MSNTGFSSKAAPVRFEGVSKVFGKDVVAVDNINLEVEAGKLVTLLGPSGCGKSTTLRMVAGVERQNAGEILVDGRVISDSHTHIPPEERQNGLLSQDFALFPHLRVRDNVGLGLSGDKMAARHRVGELFARVGLPQLPHPYPPEP